MSLVRGKPCHISKKSGRIGMPSIGVKPKYLSKKFDMQKKWKESIMGRIKPPFHTIVID